MAMRPPRDQLLRTPPSQSGPYS